MKSFVACALLALSPVLASEADMNRVLADWQQQVSNWQKAVQAAPTPESKAAVAAPNPAAIAPELWLTICSQTGARKETVSRGKGRKRTESTVTVPTYEFEQPWALPAVIWLLKHPEAFAAAFDENQQNQVTYYAEALVKSINRVHFSNPAIREICPMLAYQSGVREYEIIRKIYNRNTNPETRGCAALALSLMLNNPMISGVEGSEAMVRGKRIYYLKQALLLGNPSAPFGDTTLGEVAAEQTYRLRYLTKGCIPPQIRLRTAEGQSVTYPVPDKVNLLLFWSPEEPAGAAMVADIEQLQTKYPELEICAIAPNLAPEDLQSAVESVPGMSLSRFDDVKGTAGSAYRVTSLPTVVLLSKRSTVLYIGAPGVQLQTSLDAAMKPLQPNRPKVTIQPAENEAPVIQPGSRPKPADGAPAAEDAAPPALRDMPTF